MQLSHQEQYPMKTSAIVCAVLAGSFGFGSVASARDHREDRGDRGQRFEQRQDRQERREFRQERREQRAYRQERQEDRAYRQGYRAGVQQPQHVYQQPRHVYQQPRPVYQQPRYVYSQPSYSYSQPSYRSHAPRFYRGGYLPHQYRSHAYYVNDWHSHHGLYAPPYGHQWVNVDGEFLLIALATGLIANALLN
jgi:Ni/Co efflux regulator RcnB